MSKRDIVEPTTGERGEQTHPAWAMIGASRVQSSPPGATLFDSDVRHQHYVVVRLSTASRRRDLNHDYLYAERQIVEVAMSEAQWASFVSSMNSSGVPCTVFGREGEPLVPGMPHEPRLQESMTEVRDAADKAIREIRDAFAAYKEHKIVANLRRLESAIGNAPANVEFAAESLNKHAENVVQRARADIEAMVTSKAQQLGIEPGDLGIQAELEQGDSE